MTKLLNRLNEELNRLSEQINRLTEELDQIRDCIYDEDYVNKFAKYDIKSDRLIVNQEELTDEEEINEDHRKRLEDLEKYLKRTIKKLNYFIK